MKWRRRCGLLVLLIFLQANGVGGFRQLLRKLTFAKKKVNKTLQEAEVELSCSGSHRSLGTARCIQYSDHLQQESAKAKSGLRGMLSTAVRYLSTVLHGVIFSFIMRIFNRFTTKRKDILLQHVFEREAGQGLLTVSNHQSVLDDPGLWAALLPWWRLHPDKFRWTICTEDVFFYVSC